ncbi:hypothetical protein [Burkholderia glumae]|uniref:hypothetical protein n=1 Tax=Burkholderia glumae TaxID=337 RepID=UPI003B9A9770
MSTLRKRRLTLTAMALASITAALGACGDGDGGPAAGAVFKQAAAGRFATSNTPNFGPNVVVFDPGMSSASIQSRLDNAFNSQLLSPTAQFGSQRYAFLFKPGSYSNINANVGFYTSIAGLGRNPDDTGISGSINVDSGWNYGDQANATQNFWRSVENLAVTPNGGTDRWAVSQAAPMRRVHIRGNLTLGPSNQGDGRGYSSGGFIADSKIDGTVSSGSQQQWYTRDSTIGGWTNGVWNMVFSGVSGARRSRSRPPGTPRRPTPRSPPRRSRVKSRISTSTARATTTYSCPRCAPTPAPSRGARGPRRAPRFR